MLDVAYSPADAVHPEFYRGLIGAWSPSLGSVVGDKLLDLTPNKRHATAVSIAASDRRVVEPFVGVINEGTTDPGATIRFQSKQAGVIATKVEKTTPTYWDVGAHSIHAPERGTVSCWVKTHTTSPLSFNGWLGKTSSSSWTDGFGMFMYAAGGKSPVEIAFYAYTWTTRSTITTDSLAWGGWHYGFMAGFHVVGTWDGVNNQVWVNGVPGTPAANANTMNGQAASFNIGRISSGGSGYAYNGYIDDILLWNRPLKGPEIRKLFQIGRGAWAEKVRRRLPYLPETLNRRRRLLFSSPR